jgi:hypothetical protein
MQEKNRKRFCTTVSAVFRSKKCAPDKVPKTAGVYIITCELQDQDRLTGPIQHSYPVHRASMLKNPARPHIVFFLKKMEPCGLWNEHSHVEGRRTSQSQHAGVKVKQADC